MNRRRDDVTTLHDQPEREVVETVYLPLRVKLTTEERLAKGDTLAELLAQHHGLVEEHKAVRAKQKTDLQAIDDRIDETRKDVATGTETRSVECERVADYGKGVMLTIRLDTRETVSSRPLEAEDRQRSLT